MVCINRLRFAVNLRREREEAGLSRWAVAQALGVGLTAYSRWESGAHLPSLDSLVGLCAALDCHASDLLDGACIVCGGEDDGEGQVSA